MLKWHENMSPEEEAAILAEVRRLDDAYAGAAEFDAALAAAIPCEEEEENFDPIRDGWVDRNGRP